MPEHIHLLVNEPPRIVLAQFLKALKQITSRKLRGQREKFWQDRYYDSSVFSEKAHSEVIYLGGPNLQNGVRYCWERTSNADSVIDEIH